MKISLIFPAIPKNAIDVMSHGYQMPRDGVLYIATAIKNAGHEVSLFDETIYKINWEDVYSSKIICFSLLSMNSRRGFELAGKIKSKRNVPIIMGGVFPTFSVHECLENYCDIVVRKEGEKTIVELIKALENKKDWSQIKGIAYKKNGKVIINEDRVNPPDCNFTYDPTLLRGMHKNIFSALWKFVKTGRAKINLLPISITRGCPYNCKFCYGIRMTGRQLRKKDISTVIEEIKEIKKCFSSKRFIITDLNFTADRNYCKRLLKEIIKNELKYNYIAMSRIEVAKDEELLSILNDAGVGVLFVGIESVSDDALTFYNKKTSVSKIIEYIQTIHKHGLAICASFVAGADTDTRESVRQIFDFAIKNDLWRAYVFSLSELPNQTAFYGYPQLIPDYRIIPNRRNNHTGTLVGFFPKKMKPSTLQKELLKGYTRLISIHRIIIYLLKLDFYRAIHMWFYRNATIPAVRNMRDHIRYLQKVEQGYYSEKEALIEEKLKEQNG